MHARVRPDVGAVIDSDVTGQRGGVGHNDVIANQAIVRDVSLGHQKAIVADLCQAASASGAAMDGDELPNARAAAYYGSCFLSGELQILRRQANRHKRVDVRLVIDLRAAINHAMRINDDAFAEDYVVANYCVRSNLTACADLRARTDDCG
jgi:hypothetical protein